MTDRRPLPKNWHERVRDLLPRTTKPALRVEPKGPRSSGPHPAGDTWHQPPQQFAMDAEAAGLMSEKPCAHCGKKVIAATGELIGGLWCGPCATARDVDPPNAA